MELRLIDGTILQGDRVGVKVEEDNTVTHIIKVENKDNLKGREIEVNEKEIFLLLNQ